MHKDHARTLKQIGMNIRSNRKHAGISIKTLAKLSGVSRSNCEKIEQGNNATILTIYRLCWSIGIHPREVLPDFR